MIQTTLERPQHSLTIIELRKRKSPQERTNTILPSQLASESAKVRQTRLTLLPAPFNKPVRPTRPHHNDSQFDSHSNRQTPTSGNIPAQCILNVSRIGARWGLSRTRRSGAKNTPFAYFPPMLYTTSIKYVLGRKKSHIRRLSSLFLCGQHRVTSCKASTS